MAGKKEKKASELPDLESVLKIVADGMKGMAQGIEALAAKVEGMAGERGAPKPKAKKKPGRPKKKAAAKPAKASRTEKVVKKTRKPAAGKAAVKTKRGAATATVLGIVEKNAEGINTAGLVQKTGFNAKKIQNIVYKLKKQGKVKNLQKGLYVKA